MSQALRLLDQDPGGPQGPADHPGRPAVYRLADRPPRCRDHLPRHEHVRAFGEMLTARQGQHLSAWITTVQADDLPGLTSFATGLLSDLDAVTAGLN